MKVLSAETNLSSATNVSSESVVRIFNSDSSAATVTKKDSGGSIIGSFTMSAGEVVYSEKDYTDTLEGGSGLKVSKVGYSHMMSYASYSSGGGGGSLVSANNILLLDANLYSGSGNWLDTSGTGNDATLYSSGSGLTYVNSGDADYFNFADDGGGVQNYFKFSSGIFDPLNDQTFSIWCMFSDLSSHSYQAFCSKWDASGGLLYRYVNGSGLNLVRSNQSNKGYFSNSSGLLDDTIYNFTFTRSGNTYTAYINGVNTNPISGNTIGTVTTSDSSFLEPNSVGADKGGDDQEGRIYHVMSYSDALTASEVLQNFDALKSRYGY